MKKSKGFSKNMDDRENACLFCFAVFPENEKVKKRLLAYWWVGEGKIEASSVEETSENIASKRLKAFVQKGLIEPIHRKQQIYGIDHDAKSFRMTLLFALC